MWGLFRVLSAQRWALCIWKDSVNTLCQLAQKTIKGVINVSNRKEEGIQTFFTQLFL